MDVRAGPGKERREKGGEGSLKELVSLAAAPAGEWLRAEEATPSLRKTTVEVENKSFGIRMQRRTSDEPVETY
jgi:hypothetical protein